MLSAVVEVLARLEVGVILFDETRHCSFCSNPVVDILGSVPNSDREFVDRLTAGESDRIRLQNLIDMADADHQTMVLRMPEFGGVAMDVELTVFRLSEASGDQVAVVVRDVTELAAQQATLERLNRLASVGQVAAGVAHEFNNNLTSVLGWTQIALQNVGQDSPAASALEIISGNAKKAKRIFSRLLNLSRSKTEENVMADVSPVAVVEDVMDLLAYEMKVAKIEVVRSFEDVGCCYMDEDSIGQVIVNIVRNAIDAVGKGGIVKVAVAKSGNRAQISVEDNGPGISDEVKARIFDPFFTTKKGSEEALHGGTGLGLSISQDIVQRHGGKILVESQRGHGARFIITLPLTMGEPQYSVDDRRNRPTIPPGAMVLVIDDGPDVGEMIRTSLELKGVSVIAVRSGAAALDYLKKMPFDAAFVDYSMPGLSGHELGREIQSIKPDLPLIFMSGLALEKDDIVTEFIKKPFDLDKIQEKLYDVLKRRKDAQ